MMDLGKYVNRERLVSRFVELVKISSLSGEEEEISRYLADEFGKLSCKVTRETCGNIIAHYPAAGRSGTIMFCAHMDTVGKEHEIRPIIEDDIIRTDGSTILGADDKSGLAVMFEMLEILNEHPGIEHPELEMVSTISEEKGLIGAKKMDKNLLRADWGVVLDTGGPTGKVLLSQPYSRIITYTFHGRASHAAGAPEKGINAIKAAAAGIAKSPCGKVEDDAVIGIGTIHGGIATNVVPDKVVVETMVRSPEFEKVLYWAGAMESAMLEGCAETGSELTVDFYDSYPGYRLPEDHHLIKKMEEACKRCGIEIDKVPGLGGSDANIFNNAGIPCIVTSSGDIGAHMKSEHITIADMVKSVELHLTLATDDF